MHRLTQSQILCFRNPELVIDIITDKKALTAVKMLELDQMRLSRQA